MNIGFVGMVLGEYEIKMKSCILKNASCQRLQQLAEFNLDVLDKILDYLIENDVHLFRISSCAVPFASHEVCKLNWQNILSDKFSKVGKKALKNEIRLSMHPGQYTILCSENEDLTRRSVLELSYHTSYLDALKMPSSCKVILHIGGTYKDKSKTMEKFIETYEKLPQNIKNRLVIENDDRCYTVEDVLYISSKTGIPVVFDYLHFLLNHYENEKDPLERIEKCRATWKKKDGTQKIHYSQQAEGKKLGSHSDFIDPEQFYEFAKILPKEIDVMFEVKDKNFSVLNYYDFIKNIGTI